MTISTTSEGQRLLQQLPDIISFDDAHWHIIDVPTTFACDCGFQTFAWLHEHDAGVIPIAMCLDRTITMRQEFAADCRQNYGPRLFKVGGASDEMLLKQLQNLIGSTQTMEEFEGQSQSPQTTHSDRPRRRNACSDC